MPMDAANFPSSSWNTFTFLKAENTKIGKSWGNWGNWQFFFIHGMWECESI
jgi:hypothetical protein